MCFKKIFISSPLKKFHFALTEHGELLLGNDYYYPGYIVYIILKAIQTLLGSPDVVDETAILNSEAAKLFNENYEEYKNRVLECVEESLCEVKRVIFNNICNI